MNRPVVFIFASLLLALVSGAGDSSFSGNASDTQPVTFAAVAVSIDPQGKPLGCYQVQIVATAGEVALVGIEGGESAAFNSAPYYDPRALQRNRIVIGAYSLRNDLPAGKTRVATLMVQVTGHLRPEYQATLQVAASTDAKPIPATVSIEPIIHSPATTNGATR